MSFFLSSTCTCARSRLPSSLRLVSTTATTSAAATNSNATISLSAAKSKLRRARDPDEALSILSSLPPSSTSTPSFSFALDLAIRRLSHPLIRPSALHSLLSSLPHPLSQPLLTPLLISLARFRHLPLALHTFHLSNSPYLTPTTTPKLSEQLDSSPNSMLPSFNALLSACVHAGEFSRVPVLFSDIPSKYSVSPNHVSYGILLKSLCASGDPDSALRVLDEMRDKNVEVTAVSYTTVVDGLFRTGGVDEAERLWRQMRERGCPPDVAAYNVRIRHAHDGQPEKVLDLIKEMEASGLKPDVITYNYLLKCYCRNKRTSAAMKLYRCLRERGLVPNAVTYRALVAGLCENGKFSLALDVCWASVKRNEVPEFGIMRGLLEGLVKNSKSKEAKALLSEVRKRFPESFLDAWRKVEVELGLNEAEKAPEHVSVAA